MDTNAMILIGQGNTAEIYEYENDKILKLFRDYMDSTSIENEYHNSCVAYDLLMDCVPKVYDMVDYSDRTGIIYQKVIGSDMMKLMLSSVGSLKHLAKELAHIHHEMQINVNNKKLPSVKEKLIEDLRNVNQLEPEMKEQILRYLDALPNGNALCHFDFHPGNIIYCDNNPIIIDWMTACYGDPLSDVARTCIMLKHAVVPNIPNILQPVVNVFKKIILNIYLNEYMLISGCTIEDIEKWYPPIIAARLRESIPPVEQKRLLKILMQMPAYGTKS
ncbi:MAG TPA: aminoglycoside phosphotransferase family protein [Lachnospiraceae bacterium]|nr:aminoglycoside phosphotransferase family protein [Lachnospiraceae bacterium]